ncbi:hypothetical protein DPMN_082050 [Dreissena polymorpha]|uniref:Uncharacterized protein n=1 Tax=Dreissena polymorpha TaxID=45954 RepID=A0A9D3Y6Z4_DREPO|nr:hypothetical protein DPMN_082050 [Dreissena polymorpha]
MDHYCVRLVKKKYHAWKRFTFSRRYRASEEYCKLRNKVSKAVHYAKKHVTVKANAKKIWGYVKEQTKSKSGIGNLTGVIVGTITEDKEVLKNFFTSVFTVEGDSRTPDFKNKLHSNEIIEDVSISASV